MELNFGYVKGLPPEERQKLNELKMVYDYHKSSNRLKRRYYNGKITLREVNLGIALPTDFGRLEIGCAWGAKTVDVLAARVRWICDGKWNKIRNHGWYHRTQSFDR